MLLLYGMENGKKRHMTLEKRKTTSEQMQTQITHRDMLEEMFFYHQSVL